MTKQVFGRGVLVALAVYALVFIVMLFSVMTDEAVPLFGRTAHFALKYLCGFPLVLLRSDFSFFLGSNVFTWISIPLSILNAVIQVWIVLKLRDMVRS